MYGNLLAYEFIEFNKCAHSVCVVDFYYRHTVPENELLFFIYGMNMFFAFFCVLKGDPQIFTTIKAVMKRQE